MSLADDKPANEGWLPSSQIFGLINLSDAIAETRRAAVQEIHRCHHRDFFKTVARRPADRDGISIQS